MVLQWLWGTAIEWRNAVNLLRSYLNAACKRARKEAKQNAHNRNLCGTLRRQTSDESVVGQAMLNIDDDEWLECLRDNTPHIGCLSLFRLALYENLLFAQQRNWYFYIIFIHIIQIADNGCDQHIASTSALFRQMGFLLPMLRELCECHQYFSDFIDLW